jgi:PIN domain nuclease of toxin-antitoxin system
VSVLLDTHVLLWWQAGGDRLSRTASAAIESAETVYISPLTFWEIATLRRLGRIGLDREIGAWVQDVIRVPGVSTAPLSAEAAAWAGELPPSFPGDPIDRMLYATSRDLRLPFVSKDEGLRAFARAAADVQILW